MVDQKVALITGANRGLGLEMCRQLAKAAVLPLLSARRLADAESAAEKLRSEGMLVRAVQLDITRPDDIDRVAVEIESEFGKLDILVNNAAVLLDINVQPSELADEILRQSFEVNFFGPYSLTKRMTPLLRKSDEGRVVNTKLAIPRQMTRQRPAQISPRSSLPR